MSFDIMPTTSLLKREVGERLAFIIRNASNATIENILMGLSNENGTAEKEFAHLQNVMGEVMRRYDFGALPEYYNDVGRLPGIYTHKIINLYEDMPLQGGLIVARAGFAATQVPREKADLAAVERIVLGRCTETMFVTMGQLLDLPQDIVERMRVQIKTVVENTGNTPHPEKWLERVIAAIDKKKPNDPDTFVASYMAKQSLSTAAKTIENLPGFEDGRRRIREALHPGEKLHLRLQ